MTGFIDKLRADGYVDLGVINPEIDTLAVATRIGKVIEIPNVPTVQSLAPKHKKDTATNIYSGNYGLNEFPLHTDLAHWHKPPRFFILRSKVPVSDVFTTTLHYTKFIKDIPSQIVKRALYKPRRKLEGRMFLLRLVHERIFRWDDIFIRPENEPANYISEHVKKRGFQAIADKVSLSHKGETVLIDNWKVLHGRSEVPQNATDRVVERVYLSEIYS